MILSLTFARIFRFQHFPRDIANVNEWKIIFDPSILVVYVLSASEIGF